MSRSLHALLDLEDAEVRGLLDDAPIRSSELSGAVVAVLTFGLTGAPAAAWIAAAGRLGATVLRLDDFGAADPVDICDEAAAWADLLIVSHPLQGFSRVVGERTGCAVLNAGEDAGEDPAAGLSLLRAAVGGKKRRRKTLRAAVCGDLRGSPSAAALLGGLAAVEATLLLVPARGKDLSADALDRLARRTARRPVRFHARSMRSLMDMVDTVLLAPEASRQLPLFRQVGMPPDEVDRRARRQVEDLDVLVVAAGGGPDRLVHEPFRGGRARLPEGAATETTPGALAALLRFCFGDAGPEQDVPRYTSPEGLACVGSDCAAARLADVAPDFLLLDRDALLLECRHCGRRVEGGFAASRHERRFHAVGSGDAGRILDENLVLFRTRGEALATGFEPSRRRPAGDPGETP